MNKLSHLVLAGFLALAITSCARQDIEASYQVVPLPQEVSLNAETPFRLNRNTLIAYPEGNDLLKRNAEFLAEYIGQATGFVLPTQGLAEGKEPAKHSIVLGLSADIANKEGYVLDVQADNVFLNGQTPNGVFYGIQTLRKAIPAQTTATDILLPAGVINDEPRFPYRGLHLDVSRHFFPLEFIKEYIDLLALHNMNTFHWHLTDDQGWRIEIKRYPKLTEVGATRNRTVIGKNSGKYDNTPYGGFYTQEEAREIVKYARERYIDVIPEVDLPGHMLAALAAYPELGCTGGPYEVCPEWGIFEDVLCIGNDKTFEFLEGVMEEIIDIFPSRYIHIGGDECPRTRWQSCPKCQARIKAEGLKADKNHTAEDRLQSYCMTRIEKFLNAHGRQIIGWDEILDGDVAPNATVMSWRGMEGGIKAAQLGHDVIMVPTSYAYLDYYQTDDLTDEPFGIGGYVPVEKVYSLEPVPATLTAEQAKHILGAQANLWTEYILTPEHAEYMILPRIAALCEVQWTQPEKKDFQDFAKRLVSLMKLYQRDGLNYAKHIFNLKAAFTPDAANKTINVTLGTVDDAPIYYTLDGTEPTTASTLYDGQPVTISQTAGFCAVAIRPEGNSKVVKRDIDFNKATLCPITLTGQQPAANYAYDGAITLVDGMKGSNSYTNGAWLGFIGGDVTAVIDLGAPTEIQHVAINANISMDNWIMGCKGLEVAVSDDNETFRPVSSMVFPDETDLHKNDIETYEASFNPVEARYVKVTARPFAALPKGHDGAGKAPYLFIDEISID